MQPPATAAQPVSMTETTIAPVASPLDDSGLCTTVPPPRAGTTGRSFRIERALMRRVLSRLHEPPIWIALWDGAEIRSMHAERKYTLRIHDRGALWRIGRDPQ